MRRDPRLSRHLQGCFRGLIAHIGRVVLCVTQGGLPGSASCSVRIACRSIHEVGARGESRLGCELVEAALMPAFSKKRSLENQPKTLCAFVFAPTLHGQKTQNQKHYSNVRRAFSCSTPALHNDRHACRQRQQHNDKKAQTGRSLHRPGPCTLDELNRTDNGSATTRHVPGFVACEPGGAIRAPGTMSRALRVPPGTRPPA